MAFPQVAESASNKEQISVYSLSVTYQIGYLVGEIQILNCAVKL